MAKKIKAFAATKDGVAEVVKLMGASATTRSAKAAAKLAKNVEPMNRKAARKAVRAVVQDRLDKNAGARLDRR